MGNVKYLIGVNYRQLFIHKGLELTLLGLGLVHVVSWLCDLLQSFSRWTTVLRETRPEVECTRFTAKCFVEFTGMT